MSYQWNVFEFEDSCLVNLTMVLPKHQAEVLRDFLANSNQHQISQVFRCFDTLYSLASQNKQLKRKSNG